VHRREVAGEPDLCVFASFGELDLGGALTTAASRKDYGASSENVRLGQWAHGTSAPAVDSRTEASSEDDTAYATLPTAAPVEHDCRDAACTGHLSRSMRGFQLENPSAD
jgi:hypothetical protein